MGDDVQGRGRLSGSGSWTVIEGRMLFSLLAASCFLLFLEGFSRVFGYFRGLQEGSLARTTNHELNGGQNAPHGE